MGFGEDMEKAFYIFMCIAAFVGWAVIEFVIWLFSFISISFN
jgi:hypothetical protein